MALIVQKYGGTSLAGPDIIRRVARRVVAARRAGDDLLVVASAMGHTTDELLDLAASVVGDPRLHPRELDMLLTAGERIAIALLAMAIRSEGEEAISFTGSQAAIITDSTHLGARIQEVRAERVREQLAAGRVVIVAGFQGVSRTREITTLGRGGSDTTAVALAAALGAEWCDIFTDVDGVHTADPRQVPDARRIPRIDYAEMIELAGSGAQVLHPRAVEIGARFRVQIRVRSSFIEEDSGGTLIADPKVIIEQVAVRGLASDGRFVRLTLRGLPGGTAVTAAVLGRLADAGVSVDMVAQADRADGRRQLQLTVREGTYQAAREICERLVEELGADGIEAIPGLCRVTMVGTGMHDLPGVYARALRALVEGGLEVLGLSTSSVSISLLVAHEREGEALRLLHAAFELEALA